ncbi:hypothetical protein GCM10010156_52520 [Planobispora rosea]|uniref:HTH cro/C1-type domain-containing protein n=2 Tax=Planobispora rosea TaxID=35762 RepID=A0A8J3S4H4_PLARO|nr:hypothetical protein GCM10010156_52520 [Planobispora rosea]GIH86654.1 hypothetical protein Pro02_50620 [Planobispora rosea]
MVAREYEEWASLPLGERIRRRREAAGSSQRNVALVAGISRGTLVSLEGGNGTPGSRTLYSVLTALGLKASTTRGDHSPRLRELVDVAIAGRLIDIIAEIHQEDSDLGRQVADLYMRFVASFDGRRVPGPVKEVLATALNRFISPKLRPGHPVDDVILKIFLDLEEGARKAVTTPSRTEDDHPLELREEEIDEQHPDIRGHSEEKLDIVDLRDKFTNPQAARSYTTIPPSFTSSDAIATPLNPNPEEVNPNETAEDAADPISHAEALSLELRERAELKRYERLPSIHEEYRSPILSRLQGEIHRLRNKLELSTSMRSQAELRALDMQKELSLAKAEADVVRLEMAELRNLLKKVLLEPTEASMAFRRLKPDVQELIKSGDIVDTTVIEAPQIPGMAHIILTVKPDSLPEGVSIREAADIVMRMDVSIGIAKSLITEIWPTSGSVSTSKGRRAVNNALRLMGFDVPDTEREDA